MGISSLTNFVRRGRHGIVLLTLGVLLAAAALAAIAVAGDDQPKPAPARAEAGDPAGIARAQRMLKARSPLALFSAKALRKYKMSAARRPKKPRERTRVLAAAVDWPYTYSIVAKSLSFGEDGPSLGEDGPAPKEFRTTIVRRNAISGERKVLLRTKKSMPMAIHAGGGGAYVGLLDQGSAGGVVSRIISFDRDTAKPVTIASDRTTVSDNSGGDTCGRSAALNGVGPAGEALVWRLTQTCTTDGLRSADSELIAIARDGSTRLLDPSPNPGGFTFGRAELAGDRLVQSGMFTGSISSLDTVSGQKARLFDSSRSTDTTVATDGSVVISPLSDMFASYYYYYDEGERSSDKFFIYPQSNADAPAVIAEAGYKTATMQYCGQQLYELRLPRSKYTDGTAQILAIYGGLPVVSKFQVYARDIAAASPRLVTTTDELWVRSVGCDGEALVLATDKRTATGAVRIGP